MKAALLARTAAAVGLGAAALAACAPAPGPGPIGVAMSSTFDIDDFAWSNAPGQGVIEGEARYSRDGRAFACAGSVGLTPETPYTRHRFLGLYGSLDQAALPASVVRARTVGEASDDYRAYVRDTTCDAQGRFRFEGLPDGGWFVIAPVRAEGEEPVVLMRRVRTESGRVTAVTLG